MVDREIAVKLGSVRWKARQDAARTKARVVVDGLDRCAVADDLTDEGKVGPLLVDPLVAETVDRRFLLKELQALFGKLAERYPDRMVGIE